MTHIFRGELWSYVFPLLKISFHKPAEIWVEVLDRVWERSRACFRGLSWIVTTISVHFWAVRFKKILMKFFCCCVRVPVNIGRVFHDQLLGDVIRLHVIIHQCKWCRSLPILISLIMLYAVKFSRRQLKLSYKFSLRFFLLTANDYLLATWRWRADAELLTKPLQFPCAPECIAIKLIQSETPAAIHSGVLYCVGQCKLKKKTIGSCNHCI